jgi:hypothetical protein
MTPADPLEAALSGVEDIPDDGFADRVLSSLPGRRVVARRRAFVLGCSAIVAAVVGLVVFPGGRVLGAAFSAATATLHGTGPQGSTLVTLAIIAVIAWLSTVLVRLVADGP